MKLSDWKDLGSAYSLANLFFIISWKELIYPGMHHYLRPEQPSIFEYLAIFTNVLLLTLIFFGLIQFAKSSRPWIGRIFQLAFVVLGILAFGPLSYELLEWLSPKTERFINFYVPAIVFSACLIFAVRDRFGLNAVARNLKLAALFLLPFSLLIVLESLRDQLFTDPNTFLPQIVQTEGFSDQGTRPTTKVVWVVFDELDFSYLSAAGQNGTDLRDFERLTDESFVAQNAFAPNNRTQESIPALLTGESLREAFTTSPNDLLLYPSDNSEPFSLRQSHDIFAEVKSRGGKSAIIGWYHPYCRIFQDRVSQCYWSALASPKCSGSSEFTTCSLRFFLRALEEVPFGPRLFPSLPGTNQVLEGESRDVQLQRNEYLTNKAAELVSDPNLNLLFFHFSIPHFPLIGRYDHLQDDETYYSSLEMVNDTLRTLRTALEAKGQWDDTVVIASSDHFYRFKRLRDFEFLMEAQRQEALNDRRVPFIVKFAGQKSRIDYEPTLNTVITKRLILDIFDEKLKSSEELVLWLDNLQRTHPDLIKRQSTGRIF